MAHLLVQWPRFGPYHLARLRALGAAAAARGDRVTGLETASQDAAYAWRTETEHDGFDRVTVFPGEVAERLAPRRVWNGTWAALDRLRPDALLINSYSQFDALACLAWARTHRRVAVCVTDSRADDGPRRPLKEALKRRLVRHFDAGFVGGTVHVPYLATLGVPAHRIAMGCDVVDNDAFAGAAARVRRGPRPELPGLADRRPYLLGVSRFLRVKHLPGLLDAYGRYAAGAAAPHRLVLVGDGPERAALEAQAAALGAGEVVFAGFQQADTLPAYYALADALVFQTAKDTWGLAVNEAMATGLPVLVSNRAGCAPDLVAEGETGWTYPPDDADALADLLGRVAALAPGARAAMGAAGRARIAAWGLDRYVAGAYEAVAHGASTAHRGLGLDARALLWAMRHAARHATSFHSHRDA